MAVAVDAVAVATMFPPRAMATLLLASICEVLLSIRLLVDRIIVQFWPSADRGSSVASEVRVCLMASRVLLMTCCRLTLSCRRELLTSCRRGLSTARGRARSGWPVHFLTSWTLPLVCEWIRSCTWLTVFLTSRDRLCILGIMCPVVLAGAEVCRLVIRLSNA